MGERSETHGLENRNGERPITREEIEDAISKAKIPADILKLLGENGIPAVVDLFNDIYDRSAISPDWLKSVIITIPKKPNVKKCRTIVQLA